MCMYVLKSENSIHVKGHPVIYMYESKVGVMREDDGLVGVVGESVER